MENIIKIENLKKIFRSEKIINTALQDINIEIKKGEVFGIIGLSGAGKSTLVRMMNYLEKPTEGNVYFEDRNIGALSETELRNVRKKIGMIFQNFNLLEQKTVLKNVLFPMELSGVDKKKAVEKAKELLSLVDLSAKEKEYPSKLSGGQKQRVAIARALAMDPKVILCDEATSALDPKTTSQILDLLKKINKELSVTIVIITHQMNVIEKTCDRVAIIDGGRIAEMGNVNEIFKSPKSEIGKKLIFGASETSNEEFVNTTESKCLRMVFDGNSTNEPIIANMALRTGYAANILFANIKNINGKFFGQLVIEMPKEKDMQEKVKDFLQKNNVTYLEVE